MVSGRAMLMRAFRLGFGLFAAACLASCSDLPGSGPSTAEVSAAAKPTISGEARFALVDVDPNVVTTMDKWEAASLQGTFGQQRPISTQAIGIGDYVQVVIWEAGSGGLFTAPANDRGGPGNLDSGLSGVSA